MKVAAIACQHGFWAAGKYSNGFCHWPQCAWRHSDGSWQPASANFTSLATPNAVGSGKTALATLLHEGGLMGTSSWTLSVPCQDFPHDPHGLLVRHEPACLSFHTQHCCVYRPCGPQVSRLCTALCGNSRLSTCRHCCIYDIYACVVIGGHAAHFANIDQHSPFFSQERAPTSVAYAENQSMFLDSLIADGEWLARYARDRCGTARDFVRLVASQCCPSRLVMGSACLQGLNSTFVSRVKLLGGFPQVISLLMPALSQRVTK